LLNFIKQTTWANKSAPATCFQCFVTQTHTDVIGLHYRVRDQSQPPIHIDTGSEFNRIEIRNTEASSLLLLLLLTWQVFQSLTSQQLPSVSSQHHQLQIILPPV